MYMIGRGRYARLTYPRASRAVAALSSRYQTGAPVAPAAFTEAAPDFHIIAAVNMTRRASGKFQLLAQMPFALGDACEVGFSAIAVPGTATGGTVNGDWLIDTGVAITPPSLMGAIPISATGAIRDAGTLGNTMVLVGANHAALPPGAGAILIFGQTTPGESVTPNSFFAIAQELL